MSDKRVSFNDNGRTILETMLILAGIGILLLLFVDRFYSSVRPIKEIAIRMELANLRSAVNNYALYNKKLPGTLQELFEKKAASPKHSIEGEEFSIEFHGKYVEGMTTDNDGVPLDPFGNRYSLDAKTGRVRSTTKGYETW
ncbi:MAG: hypothetical protein HY886_07775 [Deltaproteobacteria bacterium]|nr:hypothetical protein [Deltaproteobacteria bacterium]